MKKYFLIIGFCILSVGSFADEDKVFDQMKKNDQKEVQKKENISEKNKTSFYYFRVGPGAIAGYSLPVYPTIGFGKRVQKSTHHGYDFSMDFHNALLINFLCLKGQYMYFFNESPRKQFYLGSGLNLESGCHIIFPVNISSVSLEITPGIKYKTKSGGIRFLQLDITQPLYMNPSAFEMKYHRFPVVGLSYGFGF